MSLPLYMFVVIIASSVIGSIVMIFLCCWVCRKCYMCRERQRERERQRRNRMNKRRKRGGIVIIQHHNRGRRRPSNRTMKGAVSPTDVDCFDSSDSDSGYGNDTASDARRGRGNRQSQDEEAGQTVDNDSLDDEDEFVCCCASCFQCCETEKEDDYKGGQNGITSGDKTEMEQPKKAGLNGRQSNFPDAESSDEEDEEESNNEKSNELEIDDELEKSCQRESETQNSLYSPTQSSRTATEHSFYRQKQISRNMSSESFYKNQHQATFSSGKDMRRSKSMDSIATTIVVMSRPNSGHDDVSDAHSNPGDISESRSNPGDVGSCNDQGAPEISPTVDVEHEKMNRTGTRGQEVLSTSGKTGDVFGSGISF